MTSTMTTTRTLRLQRGQAVHAAFDAGMVLQVAAGAVVLREPMRWLAGTMVTPSVRLDEGQTHALAEGGGCVMEAVDGDVELLQLAPASRWQGLWRRWWRSAAIA
jgi:hypothetical protein